MKMETKPKLSQKQVIKIQSLARTKNKSQTFHKNIKQKVSRFYKKQNIKVMSFATTKNKTRILTKT